MKIRLMTRTFIYLLASTFLGVSLPQLASATDGVNPTVEVQPMNRGKGNRDRAERGNKNRGERDRTRPRPPRDGRSKLPDRPRRPRPQPPRPPRRWDDDDDWRGYPPRRPLPPRYPPPRRPLPPTPAPPRGGYSQCNWSHGQLSCMLLNFRWQRPHNSYNLTWRGGVSTNRATTVGLQSLFTQGKRGRTGTAGISRLLVTYNSGQVQDLMPVLRRMYPGKVSNDGRVYFSFEGDKMRVPLRPHQYVSNIRITGDSWIDQYTPASIALTLER